MPPSRSAGLLAFLLTLPSLALVVPPATEASSVASPTVAPATGESPDGPSTPGAAMDARLRRLSEAIRARADQLEEGRLGGAEGEPWVAAGAWGNGRGRGWVNSSWPNRSFGNYYSRPPVWANYRPGWGNFRNGPGFLNW